MKRLALTVVLCLLAGAALGTFEIADPANQIMDELQNGPKKESVPQGDADEAFGDWAGKDVGNTSCDDFVIYRKEISIEYWSSLYWLRGFINGVAYQQTRMVGNSHLLTDHDTESLALWIENYCQENPEDSLGLAAVAFVEEYAEWEQ